jgi:hypothetical protein
MENPQLNELRAQLNELDLILTKVENSVLAVEKAKDVPIDEEATVLDDIRDLLSRMRVVDSLIVSDLGKRTPYEDRLIPIAHGGTVEVKKSTPRKTWDHELLKPIVAEYIMEQAVDKETGSIEVPTSLLIQRMLDYVSFSSWKVTALKAAGIDPDKYCEVGERKATVQIRH